MTYGLGLGSQLTVVVRREKRKLLPTIHILGVMSWGTKKNVFLRSVCGPAVVEHKQQVIPCVCMFPVSLRYVRKGGQKNAGIEGAPPG